jgi:hypothetical protein
MKQNVLCDPYLWEYPPIILSTSPFKTIAYSCSSEIVNQIFVVVFIFTAFGAIVSLAVKNIYGMLAGFAIGVLFSIPYFVNILFIRKQSENFQDSKRPDSVVLPSVNVIGSKNSGIESQPYVTSPNAKNPFMNVLIDELKYNPTRPRAASVLDPVVKVQLDDFFRTEFFNDPTDVFGRSQGQRQFITMPATSIPNDVDSYQNWLYKIPGKTCKEGNPDACVPGTNGGAVPWLSK